MKYILLLIYMLLNAPVFGQIWEQTAGPVEDNVIDLCVAPNGWIFATTPFGLNRSTNRGDHWTRPFMFTVPSGLPCVMVAQNGNIIFSGDSGIYISTDCGETFAHTFLPKTMPNPVTQFATSSSGRIFAVGKFGTTISDDHGMTWRIAEQGVTSAEREAFAIAASNDTVIALHKGSLYVSVDNGELWQRWSAGLTSDLTKLHIFPDGAWIVSTETDIMINTDHSFATFPYWTSLVDSLSPLTPRYFWGIDRTEHGVVFVSAYHQLWLLTEYSQWTLVNTGLDNMFVRRVAYDKLSGTFYVATMGKGVCKTQVRLTVDDPAHQSALRLQVFPNPIRSSATLRFHEKSPSWYEIELRNILGVVVWKNAHEFSASGTNTRTIDVQSIPPSNYLFVLRTNERTETQWVTIVE